MLSLWCGYDPGLIYAENTLGEWWRVFSWDL